MLVFALVSFAANVVRSFVRQTVVCVRASARRSAYLNAKNTNTHKICRNRFDAPVALSIKHRGFFCILHFSAKRKIIYQMHMAHFSFHCILLIKHTVLRPRPFGRISKILTMESVRGLVKNTDWRTTVRRLCVLYLIAVHDLSVGSIPERKLFDIALLTISFWLRREWSPCWFTP